MQSKIAQLYKTIELLRLPLAEPFQLQQTGLLVFNHANDKRNFGQGFTDFHYFLKTSDN